MEQKITRIPALIAALCLSVVGFFLRNHQLRTAFDEVGVVAGSKVWVLAVVSILAVALFAAYAFGLTPRKKYGSVSSRELPLMLVSVAASCVMLISGILTLTGENKSVITGLFAVLTACGWIAVAFARYQGKKAHTALFLIPSVYYILALISRFRGWTQDPVLLDYCFSLFAMIFTVLALHDLATYSFDRGNRRRTTFFALCGLFFNVVALPGTPAGEKLGYLAAALWLLANLWLLLRPAKAKQ